MFIDMLFYGMIRLSCHHSHPRASQTVIGVLFACYASPCW
jgi:hypothetical protein